jgi:Holliday junction resolvase-like predicted endonuclease
MGRKLVKVVKWDGSEEFFQSKKLLNSLKRSGASHKMAKRIVEHVEGELKEGMKTSDIYRHAFDYLRQDTPGTAARYDLKKAILRLGPSGYPFEHFIAELWKRRGYQTQVGQLVRGRCVEHEVDVIAENDTDVIMMECKYHNYHDTKSDIKTALYVHARMEDLAIAWYKKHKDSKKDFYGCLVTNTKFSQTARDYAECVGLNIISWNYPPDMSLAKLIDESGLHPITCLTTLTEGNIKVLLNEGHVLCRDLPENLRSLRLSRAQRVKIEEEVRDVCKM